MVRVIAVPKMPMMEVTLPVTVRNIPRNRTAFRMPDASPWFSAIHSDAFPTACPAFPIQSFTVGSRFTPSSSVTLCNRCFNTVYFWDSVALMAVAISWAALLPPPSASYISRMPVCSSPVFPYRRSMTATASSEPKASFIFFFSTASMVSPYLLFRIPRISGRLLSCLSASRKLSPSFSPAPVAAFNNALYLVAASLPDMVACSMPSTDSCSSNGTLADVAVPPRALMAEAISEPLVLYALTAVAIPPANISPNSRSDSSE